jgi:hypothetical protein
MDAIHSAAHQVGREPYAAPRLKTLGNVHEVTRLMVRGGLLQGPAGLYPNSWSTASGSGIELTS